MKRNQIVTGIIVALCGAVGYFSFVKLRGGGSGGGEDAAAQGASTVVTVQTGSLKRMNLPHYVTGYGTVAPAPAMANEPAAAASIAAPVAGVVTKLDVVEGQSVRQGQLLVELNSAAMTEAYAKQEVARLKKLYAQHNTSLKNLQNAEAQLALLRVTAPLSGTVVILNVKPGAAVDMNTVVAEVMDLKRLVVQSAIPESQAGELRPGQTMEVLTGAPVKAPLAYVSPAVDTHSGTVLVWATLPAGAGLRPGQFVPLRIVTAVHTNCLAAPEESVVTDIAGQSVLSLVQGDEAIRKKVQTGFRDQGWVEVKGTELKPGDTVVTVGAYGLPDKTKIQIVNPNAP